MANNVPWYFQRALRNGDPLPGAKLYAYVVNTAIPKVIYADVTLETPLVTPLVANGDGLYPQYFLGSGEYTFVETDANDVQNGDPRNYVSATGGDGSGAGTTSVCAKSSFPENAITWDTDPDAARFRTDGCFCWIYPAQNVSRIKWFKTVSAFNATYPTGKVSIWGALSEDFADGVKLDEFILPDSTPVGVQTMDHDVSAYRWIGVACDPGLMDPGVPVAQTGLVLPSYTPSLAPRYFGYIGQHTHNTTFATFPPIYADEVRYLMTRWMELGLIYKEAAA